MTSTEADTEIVGKVEFSWENLLDNFLEEVSLTILRKIKRDIKSSGYFVWRTMLEHLSDKNIGTLCRTQSFGALNRTTFSDNSPWEFILISFLGELSGTYLGSISWIHDDIWE